MALGLVIIGVALWLTRPDTPVAPQSHLRIAILPFENLSPDPDNAFFADGLHEEILTSLARRAPTLAVISRTTMMSYRQQPKPARDVAQELGATHLLEGTIRREAQNVRLTLQLIDAASDRQIWSQSYDRTLTSALTLQSEVASQVAAQLSVQFAGGPQLAVPETRNPDAYDLYLKALVARLRVSPVAPPETLREVDDLLTRSLELDPSFAAVYAQRATFRGAMFAFNYDTSRELVQSIRDDLASARRLAPDDPIVLAADALYWNWIESDLPRALALYERAEAKGLTDTMYIAGKAALIARMGRLDDANQAFDQIRRIDPGNPFVIISAASTRMASSKPAEALSLIEDGLRQFPDMPTLHLLRGQITFYTTGHIDDWGEALRKYGPGLPPLAVLEQQFAYMCYTHQYEELQTLLDATHEKSTRVVAGPGGSGFFGVGETPTAHLRGWLALLRNQPDKAAAHGREVLAFVAAQEEKPWNSWYLRILESSGALFAGDRARAVAAAHQAIELMPASRDYFGALSTRIASARVLAWAGKHDESMDLLEESAKEGGAFSRFSVSRDPLFAVPLANEARYQKLAAKLEQEMRATKLQ